MQRAEGIRYQESGFRAGPGIRTNKPGIVPRTGQYSPVPFTKSTGGRDAAGSLRRRDESADCPKVRIESDAARVVSELRTKPGKDIMLFGGGELFRTLLAAGLVDRVEVALIPVSLGGGIQLLASPAERAKLKLRKQRVYEKTGTISVEYDILHG